VSEWVSRVEFWRPIRHITRRSRDETFAAMTALLTTKIIISNDKEKSKHPTLKSQLQLTSPSSAARTARINVQYITQNSSYNLPHASSRHWSRLFSVWWTGANWFRETVFTANKTTRLSSYGRRVFFCGRPCDMELVIWQYERSGHQQRLL